MNSEFLSIHRLVVSHLCFMVKIVTKDFHAQSVGYGWHHHRYLYLHSRITLVAGEQRKDRQGSQNFN